MTEFSAETLFLDSAQDARALLVTISTDLPRRSTSVKVAVWNDLPWEDMCLMLAELERQDRKRARISAPINRGNLHSVR